MKKYIFWILLALSAICFWRLNDAIPYMRDDCYNYDHVFPMVDPETPRHGMDIARVAENLNDIIESQYNHWFTWNGRTVVHFIDQCFCVLWGKDAYNIFAALLFALYIVLLGKTGFDGENSKNTRWGGFIAVAALGILVLEPNMYYYGCSFGCNYLLSPVLILSWLYCFTHERGYEHSVGSFVRILSVSFLAILAGWSHEGLVIPFGAYLLLYAICHWKKLNKSQIIEGVCFGIGALMLILAPGNWLRVGAHQRLCLTIIPVFENLRLFWIFLLLAAIIFCSKKEVFVTFVKREYPWLGALCVALAFSMYIGVTYPRALTGIELLSLFCLCRLLTFIQCSNRIFCYGGVFASLIIIVGLSAITYYQRIWTPRYQAAREEVKNCPDSVLTVIVKFDDAPQCLEPYLCGKFDDCDVDIYQWMYDKKKLVFLEESDLERLLPDFRAEDKMPGNNPFYRVGNYILTNNDKCLSLGYDSLKAVTPVTMHLGKYTWLTWEARAKKIVSIIKKPSSDELNAELRLDTMNYAGKEYYRYYMWPFPSRTIEAIDVCVNE